MEQTGQWMAGAEQSKSRREPRERKKKGELSVGAKMIGGTDVRSEKYDSGWVEATRWWIAGRWLVGNGRDAPTWKDQLVNKACVVVGVVGRGGCCCGCACELWIRSREETSQKSVNDSKPPQHDNGNNSDSDNAGDPFQLRKKETSNEGTAGARNRSGGGAPTRNMASKGDQKVKGE